MQQPGVYTLHHRYAPCPHHGLTGRSLSLEPEPLHTASMAVSAQPSGKPPTPPPAYSEHPAPQQHLSPNQSTSASPNTSVGPPLPFPAHAGYGPTPILAQQTQLLPYYDPRSPYAMAEASSRARWRFIEAVLWAVIILSAVSFVTGWEIQMMMARGARVEPGAYER